MMIKVTQMLMRARVKYRMSLSSVLRAVSCQGQEGQPLLGRDWEKGNGSSFHVPWSKKSTA